MPAVGYITSSGVTFRFSDACYESPLPPIYIYCVCINILYNDKQKIASQDITNALLATGQFEAMTAGVDEDEHSIEMHLPFVKKVYTVLHTYLFSLYVCMYAYMYVCLS